MKLYSEDQSPYAARVRLAIYAKDLPVTILPPPAGLKTPEFLAINPLGRIPALVLDDGTVIPESDTIVEFLADAFPLSGLRPHEIEAVARGRLLARIAELYVMPAGYPLVAQLGAPERDAAVVEAAFAETDRALAQLNLFLPEEAYAADETLTTADCALVPVLFYLGVFAQAFGRSDLLAGHRKLGAYWERVKWDPAVHRLLAEMGKAVAKLGA